LGVGSAADGQVGAQENGMMISKKSMTTKMTTAMTWITVDDFPLTRLCSAVR
jgi:hypothetical protein